MDAQEKTKVSISSIREDFEEARKLLDQFIDDRAALESVAIAAGLCAEAILRGGKIISCGNGGSMADAMHFAEELSGRFRDDRKSMAAIAISDPAYLTCAANDYGYDKVFSRFISGSGKQGDVLLAISTSGNSANILEAVKVASGQGMKVIGLSGKDGGKLKALCDVCIVVPHRGYADRIQEIHIKIIHAMIRCIETEVTSHS